MPLRDYGVLKAKLDARTAATEQTNHYQLLCLVGSERWRIAINARSAVAPSEVAYAVVTPFAHPLVARLQALPEGWTELGERTAAAGGLDYVRGNLAQPPQSGRYRCRRRASPTTSTTCLSSTCAR